MTDSEIYNKYCDENYIDKKIRKKHKKDICKTYGYQAFNVKCKYDACFYELKKALLGLK